MPSTFQIKKLFSILCFLFFAKESLCPEIEEKDFKTSHIRQNFNRTIEQLLDEQVNLKYTSFYAYQTMAFYFNRPDVGFMGFSKYFLGKSDEKLSHARDLIKFLNKRGGKFTPKLIFPYWPKLSQENLDVSKLGIEWNGGVKVALESALQLELFINNKFIFLSNQSVSFNDPSTKKLLKSFIMEEVESIKNLEILLSRLGRSENYEIGEFLINQEFLS